MRVSLEGEIKKKGFRVVKGTVLKNGDMRWVVGLALS